MYIFFIVLIICASFLMILTVLAQSPKGGMAANFGASNQVMGVRQTTDFLEKLTWGLSVAIVALSFGATMALPKDKISASNQAVEQAIQNQSGGVESPFQLQNSAPSSTPVPASTTPTTPTTPDSTPEGE